MQIEGKVNTIIYKNDKNGYTVLLLKSDDEYITAVGETSQIEVGDLVEIEGEIIFHKSYGEQLAFTKISKILPSDTDAVIKYISNGVVKGLGEKTAKKIVDRFKDDTINIIRYSPDKLLDIKGINDEKVYALSEYINDEWERWNLASFLSKYNIGVNVSNKIFTELGLEAIKIIEESPYALMEFVPSLEFKTIDILAEGLNISRTNLDRVKAGIIYFLSYIMKQGHTCIELENLVLEVSAFLEINEEHIYIAVESLKNNHKIHIEDVQTDFGQIEYIYRASIYKAEKNIASVIKEMVSKHVQEKNLNKLIEQVSENESLVLSDEQKTAIEVAINNKISIITGGPGTGKTTIIKCIIDIFKEQKIKYVLAAPTGRAARRITEMTRENASTVHRLLEITKVDDNNLDDIINYPVNKLDVDAIIIDEASMIDTVLMNNIVKAINSNTKLILVGDVYQLPAVGAGNVLKDIIESKIVKTVYLNEIYRQSAKSDIIVNAHKVKNGEGINFKNKDTDLYFIEKETMEETKDEIESLLKHRLEKKYGERLAKDVQVLTPIKKTDLGIYELNKMIQKLRIKPTKDMICKKCGEKTFYINDKVMQVVNNYDIKWDQNLVDGTGVYNGDTGKITDINNTEEYLIVEYEDGKKVKYDFDILDELDHAYAITVHKSQGSEFDTVIIPLYTCYEKLFNRNLLYTAMTRAKSLLIFIGKKKTINYMIENTHENFRKTGLKSRLNCK